MDCLESSVVARLTFTVQGKTITTLNVAKDSTLIIGRGNDVHYQIRSGALSRRHCQISDIGTSLELKDLNSLNGTFLNREKIQQAILKNGDEIQLGPIIIKVETLYTKSSPTSGSHETRERKKESGSHSHIVEKISSQNGPHSRETKRLLPEKVKNAKKMYRENDFPSGKCLECGVFLTSKEMASHAGIFKEDTIYCMECFCKDAGNFPKIGGYRIVKKLGSGGMGDVYEAIQISMERPVAFKLMKGLTNVTDTQLKRFFREAKMGGKLNHPNIVRFIDSGKEEGIYYIAMEFIYGRDAREILEEQGPFPYAEAMRIAYYVATALDFASSRFNIVHRDIKPENILIDRDNIVKLTDFGLAKTLEDAGLSGITKSQTGVGTLYYMPPEQIADARFADQRADIYSLGVSLYEMLTAVRPFTASQMMELVQKIRYETPLPMTTFVPDIPPHVCSIVSKAMAKKPENRYQNASELLKDLTPFVS